MNQNDAMLHTQPPSAQVWIYTADRQLEDQESARIHQSLAPFLAAWQSHGRQVLGEAAILHNRFLIIGAHIPDGTISGCGIDASTDAIDSVSSDLHVGWINNLHVVYRAQDGSIKAVLRPDFRRLIEAGEVNSQTPVFDLSIATVGDLRNDRFEKPFSESWHAEHFSVPQL